MPVARIFEEKLPHLPHSVTHLKKVNGESLKEMLEEEKKVAKQNKTKLTPKKLQLIVALYTDDEDINDALKCKNPGELLEEGFAEGPSEVRGSCVPYGAVSQRSVVVVGHQWVMSSAEPGRPHEVLVEVEPHELRCHHLARLRLHEVACSESISSRVPGRTRGISSFGWGQC